MGCSQLLQQLLATPVARVGQHCRPVLATGPPPAPPELRECVCAGRGRSGAGNLLRRAHAAALAWASALVALGVAMAMAMVTSAVAVAANSAPPSPNPAGSLIGATPAGATESM